MEYVRSYKLKLEDGDQAIKMPFGAKILHVMAKTVKVGMASYLRGDLLVWAKISDSVVDETKTFKVIFKEDQEVPIRYDHVKSADVMGGSVGIHLFEKRK